MNVSLKLQHGGATVTLDPLPQPSRQTWCVDGIANGQEMIAEAIRGNAIGDGTDNSITWSIQSTRCFEGLHIQGVSSGH